MTEYWVSTERHYCEVCRSWMSANINNIRNHEKSARHIQNQRKLLNDMRLREKERQKTKKFTENEIARIEKVAKEKARSDAALFDTSAVQYSMPLSSKSSEEPQTCSKSRTGHSIHPQPKAVAPPLASNVTSSTTAPTMPFYQNSAHLLNENGAWCMAIDPIQGQPYWYNLTTLQSSWCLPSVSSSISPNTSANPAQSSSMVKILSVSSVSGEVSTEGTTGTTMTETVSAPVTAASGSSFSTSFSSSTLSSKQASTDSSEEETRVSSTTGSALLPLSSSVTSSAGAMFLPCTKFEGEKHEYVFKCGPQGLGYYKELVQEEVPAQSISPKLKRQRTETTASLSSSLPAPPLPSEGSSLPTSVSNKSGSANPPSIDGLGAWVDVPAEHSVFGNCTKQAPIPSEFHQDVSLPVTPVCEDPLTLLYMEEEGEKLLNADDMKTQEKQMYKKKSDDVGSATEFTRRSVARCAAASRRRKTSL